MRRTALLTCLLGLAVLGGGWMAIGAAGDEDGSPKSLTGDKPEAAESQAKLPPLPKKLRARVVQPQAGSTGAAAPEPADDPGLEGSDPKPTGPGQLRRPPGGRREGDRAVQRRR